MTADETTPLRRLTHSPLATPDEIANEPTAFPLAAPAGSVEAFYPDWRQRLTRNLARRSDGRWDPLTRHVALLESEPRTILRAES